MQGHAARLRALLDEEAEGQGDLSPAGEAAVRAHLRFVGEALAATAGPATRERLEDLAETLPQQFASGEDELEAERALLGDAAARELDLQFGTEPTGTDPSIAQMMDRRLRVLAWSRFMLRRIGEAVGDDAFAATALAWMGDRQDRLANTIFTMDRRAKEAEIVRSGPEAVDDPLLVNRIGQAAMLQAHTRFLVEAIAAALAGTAARRDT